MRNLEILLTKKKNGRKIELSDTLEQDLPYFLEHSRAKGYHGRLKNYSLTSCAGCVNLSYLSLSYRMF